jgi:hypothetical protein
MLRFQFVSFILSTSKLIEDLLQVILNGFLLATFVATNPKMLTRKTRQTVKKC